MKARSLRRTLVLHWAMFAAVLVLGLGLVAALALYILEDSFIDERLLQAEARLLGAAAPVPSGEVELHRLSDLPDGLQARLSGLPVGAMRELRLDDGRYVHLRVVAPDAIGSRVLLLDASKAMRVSDGLWRAMPWASVLLVLVLLVAASLARASARRIERAAERLLSAVDAGPGGGALRAAAGAQPIEEFRRLGLALADALEVRLATLEREEETLRFLAHELRTPLQSARLAFASAPDELPGMAAGGRLDRALSRLARASAAVLWLGEKVPCGDSCSAMKAMAELAEELAPLARQRGQTFELRPGTDHAWGLPPAAAEAIAGNLLLNAIQHGGAGKIGVASSVHGIVIDNAMSAELQDAGGFGLGFVLSQRLLERIGWRIARDAEHDRVRVRLWPEQKAPGQRQGSG